DWNEGFVVERNIALVMYRGDRIGVPDDRIAIRRRAVDVRVADRTAATRPANRHHGALEHLGHTVREDLADRLCRPAEQNRHLDRLFGKLRPRRCAYGDRTPQQCSRDRVFQNTLHGSLLRLNRQRRSPPSPEHNQSADADRIPMLNQPASPGWPPFPARPQELPPVWQANW